MDITTIAIVLAGIGLSAGALFNWDWFMATGRAALITKLLGSRDRVRILYLVIGITVLSIGIYRLFSTV